MEGWDGGRKKEREKEQVDESVYREEGKNDGGVNGEINKRGDNEVDDMGEMGEIGIERERTMLWKGRKGK